MVAQVLKVLLVSLSGAKVKARTPAEEAVHVRNLRNLAPVELGLRQRWVE